MVRKTKEEAQVTRSGILDSAERVFLERGVPGSTLHDIAEAAGVTRGAVYWHFKDKGDLFIAMLERVCMPLDELQQRLEPSAGRSPLDSLREHLLAMLGQVADDERARRVFTIVTQKIEYLDELETVRAKQLQMRAGYLHSLAQALRWARERGELRDDGEPEDFAIGLKALIGGLIQTWVLDRDAFDLKRIGAQSVDLFLGALRRRG